jgi:hypothetical protein
MRIKIILVIIWVFCYQYTFSQNMQFEVILKVAEAGYMNYLNKIPIGHETKYGFNSREEFKIVDFGKPYRIISLNPDFFSEYELSKDNLHDYFFYTDEWCVPLSIENDYRILVNVSKMYGGWQTVGIGSAPLAREIGEMEKQIGTMEQYGMILRIYQLKSDFILYFPDDSSSELFAYPLESAKISLGRKGKSEIPNSMIQLLPLIKKQINNHIDMQP